MSESEAFNLTSYCLSGSDGVEADCALNDAVESLSSEYAGSVVGLDTFFLLFSGALVFFMQAGFAMLCAGSVRLKNVKNIMLKNLLDACGGALGFWSLGYCFAYGGDTSDRTFIGNSYAFLHGMEQKDYHNFFFQFAFAATAATIVAGTVAERCKMSAYLCYSIFLTAFVYPVIVHSIWSSNGFMSAFLEKDKLLGVGMVDFAGSGVVHLTGGATALIAAIFLGPRKGRFHDEEGKIMETATTFNGHSTSLQMLGTFILWFGWYGFNPGSALVIASEGSAATAALCAVTTTIAAASACVTALFFDTLVEASKTGEVEFDLTMAMNGSLGGLVAITAGCSVVTPASALFIGIIGGLVYYFFSKFLVSLRIDDAVDAIPVHFANGIWGVIAVGFFASPDLMDVAGFNGAKPGVFFGGDGSLLLCEICGVIWILTWVTVTMCPFFWGLNQLKLFRIESLEEDVGLDISHHRGAAYDMSGPTKEDVDELMEIRNSRHGKVEVPGGAGSIKV